MIGSLLITGVTIIDGTGAEPVPGAAVLTDGERITYAGPAGGVPPATPHRVIDAPGKFVLPGLIDLHTHSTFDADMRTYLKNGVTSIRFAGVNQNAVDALRERIRRGEVQGPRIFSCGPMLDRSPAAYPQWTRTVDTPGDAYQTARRLLSRERVEALLVTQRITPDLLEPIVRAAHEFGRPVVGQIWATDAAQAARIGIDQVDNTSRIFASRQYPLERLLVYRSVAERLALLARGWAAIDWDLTQEIIDAMVQHGVFYCPTLVVSQAQGQTLTAELHSDPDYRTEFGATEYQAWSAFLAYVESSWTRADRDYLVRSFDMRLEWMRRFRAAGGRLVGGTDMQFGGITLHHELSNLQKVGLSPQEAIVAFTGDASRALHMDDVLGTVQAGKLADLIIVERDPRSDLRHVRKIACIIKGGVPLEPLDSKDLSR